MNPKQRIAAALVLAMSVGLAGCGGQAEQPQTQETAIPTATETAPAQAETAPAAEEETRVSAAAGYAAAIDNATLDAETYLDYAAGIEADVYKWVLSEDGDYYALAAVDESGAPIEQQENAINVGANNAERGGMGGFGGSMPGGGQMPEGGFPGGMGGKGGFGGGGGTVYQGVYMNVNITNLSNQTMAIYVPAAYLTTDADGKVTGIDHTAQVGNYTADTAPIVYLNECGGWKSSSPPLLRHVLY